jgi:tetratricopeptide (TPR) repeat protein
LLAVRTGDTNRAIRLLRAAERGEATAAVEKVLAVAYYQARQHRLFEMKMTEASRKDPKDFAPYYYLGRYYDADLNDFEKSGGCFTKAIQANPDHFPSYYYLGYSFEAQQQEARAEEYYQRALAISKRAAARFHLPLMGLARLRLAAGKNEEALTFARQAVKMGGQEAAAHKLCGKVLLAMERPAEAIKDWEAAAALDSSDAAVYYQISQAFLRLGDEQKADTALKQYKRIVAAYGR